MFIRRKGSLLAACPRVTSFVSLPHPLAHVTSFLVADVVKANPLVERCGIIDEPGINTRYPLTLRTIDSEYHYNPLPRPPMFHLTTIYMHQLPSWWREARDLSPDC